MHGHKDERTRDELAALGYERADVGLRTIAVWVFWFFAFAVIAGVATAGIYQFIVPGGVAPAKPAARSKFPAGPALQDEITVKTDIYDLRAEEEKHLHGSGPSTHVKGAYSIPIDVAIKKWSRQNSGHDTHVTQGSPDVIVKPEPSAGGADHAPSEGAPSTSGGGH